MGVVVRKYNTVADLGGVRVLQMLWRLVMYLLLKLIKSLCSRGTQQ